MKVISSLEFEECNQALEKIFDRIEINKIAELIDETPIISDIQKKFYKHMVMERYQKIILDSIHLLRG